jgi:hypothetical protein
VEKISSTAAPQTQRKFFLITFSHTLTAREMGYVCVCVWAYINFFFLIPFFPLAKVFFFLFSYFFLFLFIITHTHHTVVIDHLRYRGMWDREIIGSQLFHVFRRSFSAERTIPLTEKDDLLV